MGRRLARNLGPVTHLTPGQWTDATASGQPAVCCPECGGVSDLEREVDARSGNVIGRWPCPYVSCPFVDYLELEAWLEVVLR